MLGVRIPVSVISDGLLRNWLIGRADQLTVLCLPGIDRSGGVGSMQ